MAQQLINHGTTPGDGTGESPFSGMQKANANFTELYTRIGAAETNLAAKAPINNPTFTGTVGGITKAMVGLGNVDNTPDASKPVSSAQAAAIAAGDDLRLKVSDVYADFVASGLATPVPTNSLTGVLSAGIAYISGARVERLTTDSYNYQFSSDTYVDLTGAGSLTRTAVANGAAEPSLAAGSLRLEKVITNATKITYVQRRAISSPALKAANKVFTVGLGGHFTTIQSAIDYISTLPAWEALTASNNRDLLSWANGSSDLVIDNSNTDLYNLSLPHDVWLNVAGDSHYYPLDSYAANVDTITVGIKRIGATLGAGAVISFYTPIVYTVELLDHKYAEFVRVSSNVHIKFIGRTESIITTPSTNDSNYHGAWNRANTFTSGQLIFGPGIKIVHSGKSAAPFLTNNGNLSYNWGVANAVCFEFLPGCKLVNDGVADLFSATVYVGRFKVNGATMLVRTGSGISHFFHLKAGGDVVVRGCKAHIIPIRKTFSIGPDSRLFEKVNARRLVVEGLVIYVDDKRSDLSIVVVIGNTGNGAIGETIVSGVKLICMDVTDTHLIIVDEGVYNDDAGSVAAAGKMLISDCHIIAPYATGVKKVYRALTGSTVDLRAMRNSGGTMDTPSAGTKTVDNAFAA